MVHCVVRGCINESYAGCLISFHSFPKDDALKQRWLKALGRTSVSKYAKICHEHFRKENFECDTAQRRILKEDAVPSIFLGERISTEGLHVLSEIQLVAPGFSGSNKRALGDDLSHTPSPKKTVLPDHMEERSSITKTVKLDESALTHRDKGVQVNPHTSTIPTQTPTIVKSNVKIQTNITKKENLMKRGLRRVKKKNMEMKQMLALIEKKSNNYIEIKNIIKTNFDSIKTIKSKGLRYSSDVKKLALTVHFYSPKVYRFLRSVMKFPHPSTLRKMLRSNNCNVGFIEEVFNYLETAVKEDVDIKYVALMFDAMSIRSQITYDKFTDKHWGYVDLGKIATNDSEAIATEVLVFMIVSLKKKFKCPIGYFFIRKFSAELQASLVECAVRMLNDIGIIVKTITCDGSGTNIATYENLGCKFDEDEFITSFKFNNNEIFCLLDPPHMLKLARNALAETKLQSDEGDISFEYIQKLHQVQDEENMTFANKLTSTHVNFVGKKMNVLVKLASQLLSSSVADAIDFLKASGNEEFNDSSATVQFIRMIDRVFDLMNSKNPFGRGFKSAMRVANKNVWEAVLHQTRNYLLSLKIDGRPVLN